MIRACLFVSCVLVALVAVPASAYPSQQPNNYIRDEGPYDSEEIMDMLSRLGNLIQLERKMDSYKDDITRSENDKLYHNIEILNGITSPHEKRALDLGLSRGYSGALQAKHLIGLAAANNFGGPGRRRRNAH